MKEYLSLAMLLAVLLLPSPSFADGIVIDFETLNSLDSVTNQFDGITFSNATVLTAGVTLNEFELPPMSGSNVIFDDGGPVIISFAAPIDAFGGYFTYYVPLTLEAFDSSNNLLGSVISTFSNNLACLAGPPCFGEVGSSPNEFLQLSFANIASIKIIGDPLGGSFTADNLTYTTAPVPVPAPSSIYLLLTGVAAFFALRKKVI